MLNNISLAGRLVADPELKYTTNGTSVIQFTLAVDRDYSGEQKQTDFINCVAWRHTAEFIYKYFNKGKLMILNGTLQTRKYTTQDGQNRTVFEVIANNVYFGGDKQNTATNQNNGGFEIVDGLDFEDMDISEEDLPF